MAGDDDTPRDEPPEDLGENAAASLQGFIERIESLTEEKDVAVGKIKAEYAAAAAAGFDKLALKQIVKDRQSDIDKTILKRAVVEVYRRALSRRVGNALGDLGSWARDWSHKQRQVGLGDGDAAARTGYGAPLDGILKGRQGKGGMPDGGGESP